MAMKACRQCRALFEGSKCPECGSSEHLDSFKGKVIVLNPEASEISKKLSLTKKGLYAVRLR